MLVFVNHHQSCLPYCLLRLNVAVEFFKRKSKYAFSACLQAIPNLSVITNHLIPHSKYDGNDTIEANTQNPSPSSLIVKMGFLYQTT